MIGEKKFHLCPLLHFFINSQEKKKNNLNKIKT